MHKKWLVLEGDAVTYERIQSLKLEYGSELDWLIPFPGDWHLLKNYQEVLMKIYFDAGLEELAVSTGYPSNAIKNCSEFKRTHNFLMETWEALYHHFLLLFLKQCDFSVNGIMPYIAERLNRSFTFITQDECYEDLKDLLDEIKGRCSTFGDDFETFIESQASKDPT